MIKARESGKGVLMDIIPESDLCPITRQELGFLLMKRRHIKAVLEEKRREGTDGGVHEYVTVHRKDFLKFEKLRDRAEVIKKALGGADGEVKLFGRHLSVSDPCSLPDSSTFPPRKPSLEDRGLEWKEKVARRVGLLVGGKEGGLKAKDKEDVAASMLGDGRIKTGSESELMDGLMQELKSGGVDLESLLDEVDQNFSESSLETGNENEIENREFFDVNADGERLTEVRKGNLGSAYHPPCRKGEFWDPNLQRIRTLSKRHLKRVEMMTTQPSNQSENIEEDSQDIEQAHSTTKSSTR
eukprot:GDKJ01003518.1.p1 GENE.GDKJ01003518.1~~GDKJ01003518.1.p1  ORF type:complete len:298 (+),score=81.47 GDKJ01003518.1:190-1083(+)